MARKSELDKLIEIHQDTFIKYDSFKEWAKVHLRVKESKKLKSAFDKFYSLEEDEREENHE